MPVLGSLLASPQMRWLLLALPCLGGSVSRPGLELVGIFGGCDVSARRFPWQVSLRFYSLRHDQRRHACGGSLIHPQWVLSAAHCVQEELEACAFRVQVGQLRLYDHDQLTRVAKIIRHPQFNESLAARGGADIAPLELEAPTMLSEHVHPISLPPASLRVPLGKTCWVTGWGDIVYKKPLPPPYPLQEVDVPLVGNDDCARQYQNHSGGSSEVIRGDVLCTGREGRDSCQVRVPPVLSLLGQETEHHTVSRVCSPSYWGG
uniref:Peptidase S1 domain-containing protein n=1 Tax=Prolemur simus TaxID=1328070 RepID=A0A8C9AWD8_PROSS